jgi:hypothetical protein
MPPAWATLRRRHGQIALFARVATQIVELRYGLIDELLPLDDDSPQRRPASHQIVCHRLEIQRAIRSDAGFDQLAERDARPLRVCRGANGIDNRWHDVDVPRRQIDPAPTWRRRARLHDGDDKRHAKRPFVREQAVRVLAVFAQALAVIGRDDHQGWPGQRLEAIEKRSKGVVGPRDLPIVRPIGVLGAERLGRRIGRVRIEDMHPPEKALALAGDLVNPGNSARDDHIGRPFGHRERRISAELGDLVVVDIEAAGQAKSFRQRKTADERPGGEACGLEPSGQRRRVVSDAIAAVVADAVLIREQPGQDGRVRRQRHDRVRVREVEARAARGEPVQIGRLGAAAVGAKNVGAKGIDGDDEDMAVADGVERERRTATQPPPGNDRPQRGDEPDDDQRSLARRACGCRQIRPRRSRYHAALSAHQR